MLFPGEANLFTQNLKNNKNNEVCHRIVLFYSGEGILLD